MADHKKVCYELNVMSAEIEILLTFLSTTQRELHGPDTKASVLRINESLKKIWNIINRQ